MSYIYRFINGDNEVIYVGRTDNLDNRLMNQHFTDNGHLPQQCYDECMVIEYAELKSDNEMRIYEIYYISKFKPKYNVVYNDENNLSFELPDVDWTVYKSNEINDIKKDIETLRKTIELMAENFKHISSRVISDINIMMLFDERFSLNENTKLVLEKMKEDMEILQHAYAYKFNEKHKRFTRIKAKKEYEAKTAE